jgi:hypothetical protein
MKMLKHTAATNMGLKIRIMEIPALFRAVSSKFSPNFPKVMSDDNNMAKGNARGIVMREK